MSPRVRPRPCGQRCLMLALLCACTLCRADPNDYVHLPDVVAGEREIDVKWGQQQQRSGGDGAVTSVGLGYGVSDHWFTELYAKEARPAGDASRFDAMEWENRFLLTDPGRYPIDAGLLLEIERPAQRTEGYEISYGPLLQAQTGRWQGNFNLLIRQHRRSTAHWPDELRYEAQIRHRSNEKLDWGMQALGSFGALDRDPTGLSEGRTHRIGPALFGKLRMSARTAIAWNAALMFRAGAGEPGTTLRVQAELEF